MSILFEAWRRARGEGEEVARALGAPPVLQESAGRALPWILCAVLAALAAGLGVYLWRIERPPAPATGSVTAASATLAQPAARTLPSQQGGAAANAGQADTSAARHREAKTTAGQGKTSAHAGARTGAVTAGAAATGTAPRAPAMHGEAPEAVRQALPSLPVTVHVWNPSPAARFVVVAGHMYREGDELAPGVRLVKITRSGEVVRFRGYEISLGGA